MACILSCPCHKTRATYDYQLQKTDEGLTEHFQAPFGVIIFGSIQTDDNQFGKLSTKRLNCLAALKVACYQTTHVQTENVNAD